MDVHLALGMPAVQAAIAAVHAEAPDAGRTDWSQIVGLYDVLLRIYPSPVVELNRSVAVTMLDGPEAGLALIDTLVSQRQLENYHFLYAVQEDLYRD